METLSEKAAKKVQKQTSFLGGSGGGLMTQRGPGGSQLFFFLKLLSTPIQKSAPNDEFFPLKKKARLLVGHLIDLTENPHMKRTLLLDALKNFKKIPKNYVKKVL